MLTYSLASYIEELEKKGELLRLKEEVNPELEITEITDRISKTKDGGKALLFENTGTDFPLLINAFGSEKRMCISLGIDDLDDVGKKIDALFETLSTPKNTILEKLKMIPTLKGMSSWFPKEISKKGACQEVIMKDPDLDKLPILKCWPKDGGRFITLPIVISKDPESNIRNVGMYRMQVFDKDKTGMHWHKHKVGARHYDEYKKRGEKMPIAVVLGGDPIYTYAATAPLPDHLDEFLFAGFIRNKSIEMVKCITQDIEVPADADFVIEGYVDPEEEMLWEGPFGDHTGYYSLPDWYPAFHVTCITHRKKAIYPATIVGIPPQEDFYIGKATERIFLNPIKYTVVPEIVDMELPAEGVAHNLTIIQIDKRYSGQGQKVINSLWGAGQMMFNKIMVVIDEKVNSYDELVKLILKNVDVSRDLTINRGPLDVLDHAAEKLGFGSKIGIDATKKYPDELLKEEKADIELKKAYDLPDIIQNVNYTLLEKGNAVLIASIDYAVDFSEIQKVFVNNLDLSGIVTILFVDDQLIDCELSVILWVLLNNIDPLRDCKVLDANDTSILLVDGRRKSKKHKNFTRDWPNIIVSDQKTIELVDKKWDAYKIGAFIPSPSLKYRELLYGDEAKATE